jgi:hypothetical protein
MLCGRNNWDIQGCGRGDNLIVKVTNQPNFTKAIYCLLMIPLPGLKYKIEVDKKSILTVYRNINVT